MPVPLRSRPHDPIIALFFAAVALAAPASAAPPAEPSDGPDATGVAEAPPAEVDDGPAADMSSRVDAKALPAAPEGPSSAAAVPIEAQTAPAETQTGPTEQTPAAPPPSPDVEPPGHEDNFLIPLDAGGAPLPAPEQKRAADTPARLQTGGAPHFALGASPAYAFRLHDDARSHGGGAHLYVDAPLLWGFGFEMQVYGWGWAATQEADRPLGLIGVSPLLIYSFDDSGIAAIAGVGPTVAAGIELADDGSVPWAPFAGAQFQFGLRFPLGTSTDIDVGIRAPIYIYGPEGFTLRSPFGDDRSQAGFFPAQVSMGIGVTFEPLAFVDAVRIDDDLFGGILPHALFDVFF